MPDDDPAENEDAAETEPAAAETDAGREPTDAAADMAALKRRRDPKFRLELVSRLPRMVYEKWSAKDSFKLDEEWGGVIALQSDAILGPLEPLATDRRG
jgi:hypothetical protein